MFNLLIFEEKNYSALRAVNILLLQTNPFPINMNLIAMNLIVWESRGQRYHGVRRVHVRTFQPRHFQSSRTLRLSAVQVSAASQCCLALVLVWTPQDIFMPHHYPSLKCFIAFRVPPLWSLFFIITSPSQSSSQLLESNFPTAVWHQARWCLWVGWGKWDVQD